MGGTSRSNALAVLRLITSSNLVGRIDRQVGRLRTTQNQASVDASLSISVVDIGAVAHQATSVDELTQKIDSRNHVTRGQPYELIPLPEQKRVRADNQSAVSLRDNGCEGRVDFTFGAGVQNVDVYSEWPRSTL